MYPHFIEVHVDEIPLALNIAHIVSVKDGAVKLSSNKDYFYGVDESYDELSYLIQNCGCHIEKKDPRLDDRPLKMEQLKNMIGEPVWNANRKQWGLVCDYYEDEENDFAMITIKPYKDISYDYDAVDLEKYPVYGMKVKDAC